MMDSQFEIKLIECLSLLEEGEPIERVLARYPDDALSLRPLLETARMLPSLRREPAESARQASRRAFLNEASRLSEARLRRWAWFSPRLAMTLASVLVVFVLVGGVAAAAQSALPDDTLYSVKRALEDTRLLLAPQGDRATLASSLSQRRRDEIGQLLASGRSASVAFEGKIEMIAARRWQIAGLPVQIAAGTRISGVPAVGARAQVQGHTAAGQLLADSITIEPGSLPAATATATATASPTAQPTQSPTAQPSATELVRPTATIRPSTLPAPSAAPTARPTSAPAPTQAPAPTRPPEPTQAPEPEVEVEFEGVVEAIGSAWRVGGQTVAIDGATEIRDAINVGDTVRVRALRRADGQLIARRIDLRSDTSGGNDNANGNDDHGGDNSGSNDNANGNDDHGGGDNSGSGGGGGGDDNGGGGGGGGHGGGHGGGGGSDDNNSGKA